MVMLQNVRTGAISHYRDPRREARAIELRELRGRVEEADAEL